MVIFFVVFFCCTFMAWWIFEWLDFSCFCVCGSRYSEMFIILGFLRCLFMVFCESFSAFYLIVVVIYCGGRVT